MRGVLFALDRLGEALAACEQALELARGRIAELEQENAVLRSRVDELEPADE